MLQRFPRDPTPGKSGISNEVGRCQEGSSSFFCLLESFSLAARRTHAHAQQRAFARAIFLPSSIAFVSTLLAQTRVACIIWCCLPTISSVRVDHDDQIKNLFGPRAQESASS